MELKGEYELHADRDTVWQALNDLAVLRDCIPGCETLDVVEDNHYQAAIRAKVGPVNTKFATAIHLENVCAPESYTLRVHSKGGAAGLGEGLAHVQLMDSSSGTRLFYAVEFKVKGKLAQIGSRLIMNVVQKLSKQFFDSFSARVNATQ